MKKRILFFITSIVFLCNISYAHRIDVFCWVDGNNIKCMSKFSTGNPVVKGTFEVFKNNKLIFKGIGDKKGNFTYKIPDSILTHPEDLKIVCIAEMGHKNYWIVKKDEISSSSQEEGDNSGDEGDFFGEDKSSSSVASVSVDYKRIEKIMRSAIDKELVPIKRDIAELREPKIDFRDILGGIGYIMGVMGIILFFKSKK